MSAAVRQFRFEGDAACVKYGLRDLEVLEAVLERFVRGRNVAVQAGGNIGIFPKRLAAMFGAVYTFEPEPVLFSQLVRNVPERNVVKLQAALGHERGFCSLSQERRDGKATPSHPGLTHISGDTGIFPVMRIDDLALWTCDLIYLDVEGYELRALQGARTTINWHGPVIALEVNKQAAAAGVREADIYKLLAEHDYAKVFEMHSDQVWTRGGRI